MKNQDSNLKKLRKEHGYTQETLANEIGCGIKSLHNWESGKGKPDTYHLEKLAELFRVSTDYLLGREEYKTHDNKFICQETGLSEKALEVLKFLAKGEQESHKENIEMLNYILETQFLVKAPEKQLSMVNFFTPGKSDFYKSGESPLLENKENLLYFMRKCLVLKLPGELEERKVIRFEDGEKEEIQELRMQHYQNRITSILTRLREEHDFQEWKAKKEK